MNRLLVFAVMVGLLAFAGVGQVGAVLDPGSGGIINPALDPKIGAGNDPAGILGNFFGTWWGVFYLIAGIMFILYLTWGAIEMLVSGSNKDRVENAKNKIQNALIGLVLIAVSYALVKLVGYILGFDLLETLKFDVGRLAP